MNLTKPNEGIIGALIMTASAFTVKILGFVYKIPLSYYLGDEGMGYYNTALTIYAIFYILSASAIPKAFSILLTRARLNNTKKAYTTSAFLFSFIFLYLSF